MIFQASEQQANLFKWVQEGNGHAMVRALAGTGKSLPNSAKVLTPQGWKRMGEIRVGDLVIGADGKAIRVLSVHPQGILPVWEIVFSDHATARSSDDHLWTVWDERRRTFHKPSETLPLSTIRQSLRSRPGQSGERWNYTIPIVKEVEFAPQSIPLPGYVMGVLLGDGSIQRSQVRVSSALSDAETVLHRFVLPSGVHVSKVAGDNVDWHLTSGDTFDNPIPRIFRELGLSETTSTTKFIPECYMFNDGKVRWELLRGLLDSDGTVNKSGTSVEFSTSSERLRDDIIALINSLGGVAVWRSKRPKYRYKSEVRNGQLSYTVSISFAGNPRLFHLERKQSLIRPKTKYQPARFITKVTQVEPEECTCIKVDALDGLFLTDNFVVTHNTTSIIEAIRYMNGSVALVAFNKRIAEELQARIKNRMKKREDLKAGTFHSFGYGSWIRRHPGMKMEGDGERSAGYWKWPRVIEELKIPRPDKPMDRCTKKLVSLAKQYGFGVVEPDNNATRWKWLFEHFTLEDELFDEETGYMPKPDEVEMMMKACIILGRRALLKSAEIAHEIIDYDDMLYMPLKDPTCRIRQYDWVLIDECQPLGTMVDVVVPQPPNRPDRATNGRPTTKAVPIEELKVGDVVLSYSRDLGVFRTHGKPLTKVTRRHYDGLLTEVSVNGLISRYTLNHWCWANFRPITDGYFTYLMRRGDQFRIGICKGRYADSKSASGPAFRMYEENAEQMWLLDRYDTKAEAQVHETLNSIRYGIPMTRFVADGKAIPAYINGVWGAIEKNIDGATACLEAHGRDIRYPFFDRFESGMFPLWRPAKIRACNLMDGVLMLPFRQRSKVKQTDYAVARVSRYQYSGEVISLDVADDHMYVADGLLTHNCQDSNPVRRLYAKRMMHEESRSIWIGDEKQAVYGFAGADSESMNAIATEFSTTAFPLTTTYRCALSIVRYAQDWTPDMTAREDAPEGTVTTIEAEKLLQQKLQPSDAILCRNNAPLVELALKLIRSGMGCRVEGRDIGQNLYKLAERWKRVKTVQILKERLVEYRKHQVGNLKARGKHLQAEQVADTVDSLMAIIDSLHSRATLYDLKIKIQGMFGDQEAGKPQTLLTLSTIHKAKGREWPRVFWFGHNLYQPSPYATQEWEKQQEQNLMYVAVTRAINHLVKVHLKNKMSESPIVWESGDSIREEEEEWDNEQYRKTLIHSTLSE